jgi:hypothetical protein
MNKRMAKEKRFLDILERELCRNHIARVQLHFQPDTLDDWGRRAKHLDRSLDAYTPAPSTESSTPVLVRSFTLSPR